MMEFCEVKQFSVASEVCKPGLLNSKFPPSQISVQICVTSKAFVSGLVELGSHDVSLEPSQRVSVNVKETFLFVMV